VSVEKQRRREDLTGGKAGRRVHTKEFRRKEKGVKNLGVRRKGKGTPPAGDDIRGKALARQKKKKGNWVLRAEEAAKEWILGVRGRGRGGGGESTTETTINKKSLRHNKKDAQPRRAGTQLVSREKQRTTASGKGCEATSPPRHR